MLFPEEKYYQDALRDYSKIDSGLRFVNTILARE